LAIKSTNNPRSPKKSQDNKAAMPADFDPDVPSREQILLELRRAATPLTPEELASRLGRTKKPPKWVFSGG